MENSMVNSLVQEKTANTAQHISDGLYEERAYAYRAMPNTHSIRVLTLEPGGEDDPLVGVLECADIESLGIYEPLSYTWGQPNFVKEILITEDDVQGAIKITPSLFEAFKRLRYPDRQRRLWADQICVNQKDLQERSQQVQFMNGIYRNAHHVLVWLGVDENNLADSAFALVHQLDGTFQDEQKRRDFHLAHTEHLEEQTEGAWKGLDDLTKLAWFTRGWIVQEIGTKAPATLHWGDARIDWDVLFKVCEHLTSYHHLRSKFNIRSSDIKYVFQRFVEPDMTTHHANRINFIYELHRARGLKFTDDRDRIYAWLGHFSIHLSGARIAALRADYDTSVHRAYTEVAIAALEDGRNRTDGLALMVLAAVQSSALTSITNAVDTLQSTARTKDETGMPSWVPDWRDGSSFILSEPVSPHCAHGGTLPKFAINEKTLVLSVQGIEIDTIAVCSTPFKSKDFHVKSSPKYGESSIEHVWRDICGKSRFEFVRDYFNGDESLFACMQTLSNGNVQVAAREKRPYKEIPRSRWFEQEALYLSRLLGAGGKLGAGIHQLAVKAVMEGQEELWSRSANGASKNRTFAKTGLGYYLLGPSTVETGDIVCVLFGAKMPFCLRPHGNRYLLVGECYVHGFMEGEAADMWRSGKLREKQFDIV